MAFLFMCSGCGWESDTLSAANVGPAQSVRKCSSCGAEEREGEIYAYTPEQVAEGEIPCGAGCGNPARILTIGAGDNSRRHYAQVGAGEAAAVAVHPKTGEVVYCFANPGDPLPKRYAKAGFEKQQFHSLHALRSFCKSRGLVNDIEYDNPHEGYGEEVQRKREEAERDSRKTGYWKAREEAAREMGLDPRTGKRRR